MPATPHRAAGIRTDPPVSVPSATGVAHWFVFDDRGLALRVEQVEPLVASKSSERLLRLPQRLRPAPTLPAFLPHDLGQEQVQHIRIADASGARLGRLFGVTLWPTLVFLRDGVEVARLVRPTDSGDIAKALSTIETPGDGGSF